ncbi:hypothetical protein JKP88DRAFT_255634 [Tribonema minus]|uniref:VWFA domain-containing protein n=1 Tax=Tribonema minus TaxID=303371 RepID=A0A836CHH8_9STRA|nr:hypothetical protein JKP88DRAFT_255634 [Tribonema minus]
MKLPSAPAPRTQFVNAQGSHVPQEYAIAARADPDCIKDMAETSNELKDLQKEALARQYVIIVDRSGSMAASDGRGTRWDSARDAVAKMIDTIFKYDVDHTVPVYVFDNESVFIGEVTKASQVKQIFTEFKPRGTTDLNNVLVEAIETYAGTKRPNYSLIPGTTFIVLLDGGADDEEAVMRSLRHFADPRNGYVANHTQIALSFLQIGDDAGATRFLKRLDDEIEPDICDTKKDDVLKTSGGLDQLLYDAIFD